LPETDLELLTSSARAAGEIALKYWRNTPRTWEKPDAAGPVTEADLEVDGYLRQTLCNHRPTYGWLSEETPDDDRRLGTQQVFIVDPIDGTRAFVSGEETWALSLAVVDNGRPTAAAIYLPAKDRLFAAVPGRATLNGAVISASSTDSLDDAHLLAARPNMDPENWANRTPPPVTRHFRPSLAYRMALVAQGRFDAMLTLRRAWEWDIAAGALVAEAAGARVTDRVGASLRFNNSEPLLPGVLVGGTKVHKGLLTALDLRQSQYS
jgi:myo-inositol-1(or 4)-monophosphatase